MLLRAGNWLISHGERDNIFVHNFQIKPNHQCEGSLMRFSLENNHLDF